MMLVRKNLAEKKEHDPRCANITSVRKKKLAEKKEHDPRCRKHHVSEEEEACKEEVWVGHLLLTRHSLYLTAL
jgi:hypothetical protein